MDTTPPKVKRHLSPKVRLDQYLVDANFCTSKSQAQGHILAGRVFIDGSLIDKPGTQYRPETLALALIEIQASCPYVSRGGLKLEKALIAFGISADGLICMDIGASTGGFTDCLLQQGAQRVYAIDVGHGQLDWKLRQDERVVCMEKTNVRHLDLACLEENPIGLLVMDVSFISIQKIFPVIQEISRRPVQKGQPSLQVITLIKPQFEYKDHCVASGFDGVVKSADQHQQILQGVLKSLLSSYPAFNPKHLSYSPITGPKGNIEFLLHGVFNGQFAVPGDFSQRLCDWADHAALCVKEAHQHFVPD